MERSENQDYYGYYEPEDEAEFALKGRVIVVCDGMGGHAGGEIASRLAVETIVAAYKADTTGNVPEVLRGAIEAANRAIWKHGTDNPPLKGMGSTTVCMAMKDGIVYFGHVGDSRCYLVRQEQLIQMTRDHSLVQQMVDEGLLREEEMESHPEKNVILRSLGVKPDVEAEINYYQAQVGDIYCLSTDGLTGLVSKEECRRVCLLHKDQPMQAAQMLVDLANKYGGYDNTTVQIVRVMGMKPEDVAVGASPQAGAGVAAPPGSAAAMGAVPGSAPQGNQQTTGVYSEDDVARSIAEARAKAAGPGAAAPAPAASAPAPAGGDAPQGGSGGGKGLMIGAILAVLLVGALAVFGVQGASRAAELRTSLKFAMKDAEAANLKESKEYKEAEKALSGAEGFVGGITGGSALEEAEKALRKILPAGKGSSAAPVDAQKAKDAMLAVREPAAAAGAASTDASKEAWARAEARAAEGDAALESDPKAAAEKYQVAEAAYRTALEAAQTASAEAASADEKKN